MCKQNRKIKSVGSSLPLWHFSARSYQRQPNTVCCRAHGSHHTLPKHYDQRSLRLFAEHMCPSSPWHWATVEATRVFGERSDRKLSYTAPQCQLSSITYILFPTFLCLPCIVKIFINYTQGVHLNTSILHTHKSCKTTTSEMDFCQIFILNDYEYK